MKKLQVALLFLFLPLWLLAQKQYSGRVLDSASHAPVVGAGIKIQGTNQGVSTDTNGVFTIKAQEGAVLDISSLGYGTTSYKLGAELSVTIVLEASAQNLEQVVVIGYGTSSRKDLTAPIAIINTEDMVKRTTANPMDAIQGSVSGVQVVSNGAPGSSPSVRVRGVGSLNNENPLYVVDGMFVDDISFLNSNDIAEMSILKDASAAAIYGVRAANGVVLITTKKGKFNQKTRVTYNGYIGFQTPVHRLKMADAAQYAAMELAKGFSSDSNHVLSSVAKFGGSDLNPSTNTDWYDQILRSRALVHNHNLDIAGGSDRISYTLGVNYMYQDGILKAKNGYERYNIRLQTDARPYDWLKIGYSAIVTNSTLYAPNNAAFTNAYYASPLYPVYDATNTDATPVDYASSKSIGFNNGVFANPVAAANYYYDQTKLFQVLPTVYAEANIWGNKLTFRSQWSMRYVSSTELVYLPQYFVDDIQKQVKSKLTSTQNRNNDYILDNLLTYKDGKSGHHWSVLLGQSSRQQRWRQTWVAADSVPNEKTLWYATQGVQSSTNYGEDGTRYGGISYFARATYDYQNKYLLTATIRRDGSSKYQTKWGTFPSVGLGWVISDESFLKTQKVFDFLKLRGSWGKLGNDGIPANAGYASYNTGNNYSGIFNSTNSSSGQYVNGYQVFSFYSSVGWEVVNEWDGGLDFTLLHNRLKGSVDYYHRQTDNMAFWKSVPFTNTQLYGNWGKVLNTGWEFSLAWNDNIGKLGYSIGGNLTTLKNKVTDLGTLPYLMTGEGDFQTKMEVGHSINHFYGYQVAGIYQNAAEVSADPTTNGNDIQPGYFKYKDVNGNGSIDADDRVDLGSYLPKITYGFNLGLNYGHFDFSALLQGVGGNKILNWNRFLRSKYSDMNGDDKLVSNLWTPTNGTNEYPSAYATTQGWNYKPNSFFVESGAYLRVQNIQLGYNFNLGKDGNGPAIRVYTTADRPFIFTKYKGFTPEVTGGTGTTQNIGYDNSIYPVSASYSFGVRVTF